MPFSLSHLLFYNFNYLNIQLYITTPVEYLIVIHLISNSNHETISIFKYVIWGLIMTSDKGFCRRGNAKKPRKGVDPFDYD